MLPIYVLLTIIIHHYHYQIMFVRQQKNMNKPMSFDYLKVSRSTVPILEQKYFYKIHWLQNKQNAMISSDIVKIIFLYLAICLSSISCLTQINARYKLWMYCIGGFQRTPPYWLKEPYNSRKCSTARDDICLPAAQRNIRAVQKKE